MEQTTPEVLITRERIARRVGELGAQISRDYNGKEPLLVGILNGAFVFMADLVRALSIPCTVDFVRMASYGAGSVTSGKVLIRKDIETPAAGRDILIVEDIVDTGLTLSRLIGTLKQRNPASLKVCALLDKRERRRVSLDADYVGFPIPDAFVVGYGLDCNEQFRFLPDIRILKDSE